MCRLFLQATRTSRRASGSSIGITAIGGADSRAGSVERPLLPRTLRRLQQQLGLQLVRAGDDLVRERRPPAEGGLLRFVRVLGIDDVRLLAVRVLHQPPRRAAVRPRHQPEGHAALREIGPGLRPRSVRPGSMDDRQSDRQPGIAVRQFQGHRAGTGRHGADSVDAQPGRHCGAGDAARPLAGRDAATGAHL